MSLTDSSMLERMAEALRTVVWSTRREEHQEAADLLAEYDASRAAPAPVAKITVGTQVRTTRASRKTRDYQLGDEATVVTVDLMRGGYVVHWLTDLGNNQLVNRSTFLRMQDCVAVLNLPATNTGD